MAQVEVEKAETLLALVVIRFWQKRMTGRLLHPLAAVRGQGLKDMLYVFGKVLTRQRLEEVVYAVSLADIFLKI